MKEFAKQKAVAGIESGKSQLSSALENLSRTLTGVEGNDPLTQRVTSTASQYVGQLATYLNQHSTDDLIRSARELARNRPGILIAGFFALGFAASRLVRS